MAKGTDTPKATDAAAKLAAEHGLDLSTIQGTGSGGSIKLGDVKKLVSAGEVLSFEERVELLAGKYTNTIFQRMSEPTKWPLEVISTGCLAFDAITEAGGWPLRRFSELWGRPGTAKTTLMQNAMIEQSILGQHSVIIDDEHKLVEDYLRECIARGGGDNNYILYVAPESGGMAVELIEDLIGHVKLIVIDSICGLTAKVAQEVDGPEDKTPASTAQLVTNWVQRAKFPLGISGTGSAAYPISTAIVGINQARAKWGLTFQSRGDGLKSGPGGWAWLHGCSMRIKLTGGHVDDKRRFAKVTARVVKSAVSVPQGTKKDQKIFFGTGVDRAGDLLTAGPDFGTIIKKGNFYYVMEGDQEVRLDKESGFERARKALWAAPEMLTRLRGETHALIVAGKKEEDS